MVTVDPYLVVAVALLAAGVVGAVVPLVPGPALSVAGVWLYWWSTGFLEPGVLVVGTLTLVGLLGAAVDLAAEAIGARAGGASTGASLAGAVVGLALFLVTGPVGLVVGVAGTVLAVELYRGSDLREGARAAAFAVVAALASGLVQALLGLAVLVAFVLAVLL